MLEEAYGAGTGSKITGSGKFRCHRAPPIPNYQENIKAFAEGKIANTVDTPYTTTSR